MRVDIRNGTVIISEIEDGITLKTAKNDCPLMEDVSNLALNKKEAQELAFLINAAIQDEDLAPRHNTMCTGELERCYEKDGCVGCPANK